MQSVDLARERCFALVEVHIWPQEQDPRGPWRTLEDPYGTLYVVRGGRWVVRVVGMLLVVINVVLLLLVVDQVLVPLHVSFFGSLMILGRHPVLRHLPLVLRSPVLEPNFHLKK